MLISCEVSTKRLIEGLTNEILERGMSEEALHLAALSEIPDWRATPTELAEHLGKDRREARRMLNRLAKAEWVRKKGAGVYAIASDVWPRAEEDLSLLRALRQEA